MAFLFVLFSFILVLLPGFFFFFFNDTATTEIYTLSLHDALPIFRKAIERHGETLLRRLYTEKERDYCEQFRNKYERYAGRFAAKEAGRSEEHTSELQSRLHLVCRLLLEKKKKTQIA